MVELRGHIVLYGKNLTQTSSLVMAFTQSIDLTDGMYSPCTSPCVWPGNGHYWRVINRTGVAGLFYKHLLSFSKLIDPVILFLQIFSKHHESQTIRAMDLKLLHNDHLVSKVRYFLFNKLVELVSGGSVIIAAYPV